MADAGPGVQFTLNEINPAWLARYGDEIEELCRRGLVRELSLPMQSGNPRILHLMRRFAKVDEITAICARLKRAWPALILDTQIIVGFPSETDAEFQDTLRFLRECQASFTFVHPYYESPQIESFGIQPKCPPVVIAQRVRETAAFCEQHGLLYTAYLAESGAGCGAAGPDA